VVENCCIGVLARDYDELVPDARIDDPLAVQLSPEAFSVDARKWVAGAVHAPAAVAPADHRDELACLLVVVGRDELGQRLVRGPAAQEGDDVLSVAPPPVSASRFAETDVNRAFATRRAGEDAVARVVLALIGPLIRLTFALPYEAPIVGEISRAPGGGSGGPGRGATGIDGLDDRIAEARLCQVNQKRAELLVRNALQSDRERGDSCLLH